MMELSRSGAAGVALKAVEFTGDLAAEVLSANESGPFWVVVVDTRKNNAGPRYRVVVVATKTGRVISMTSA